MSFTSVLSILGFVQASSNAWLKGLAVSFTTLSTYFVSMLSLEDHPVGSEKFRTGLMFSPGLCLFSYMDIIYLSNKIREKRHSLFANNRTFLN